MSEAILIALVSAVSSVTISALATLVQGYKWRTGEQPRIAADAAGEITDTSLALLEPYRTEVKNLRAEVAEVRSENKVLRAKLEELEDVKDWAERLVHQVRSLGGEPVAMRVKRGHE